MDNYFYGIGDAGSLEGLKRECGRISFGGEREHPAAFSGSPVYELCVCCEPDKTCDGRTCPVEALGLEIVE